MKGPFAFLTFCLLTLATLHTAYACSVSRYYVPPSNFELMQLGDAVVVAKAVRYLPTPRATWGYGNFTFRVQESLRGTLKPKQEIKLPGSFQYYGASSTKSFARPRIGASRGMCIATDYKLHGSFLLVLSQDSAKKTWRVLGYPFARVNEEVVGDHDPWLVAARHYIRITRIKNPRKRLAALYELQKFSKSRVDPRAYPAAIADDIDRHVLSPSPHKTFEENKLFFAHKNPRIRETALMAMSQSTDPKVRKFFRARLSSKEDAATLYATGLFFKKKPDHKSLKPLFDVFASMKTSRSYESARWQIMWAIIKTAKPGDEKLMLELVKRSKGETQERFAEWFLDHPYTPAAPIFRSLFKAGANVNQNIVFVLALGGDSSVVDWAIKRLKEARREGDYTRYVATYSLAYSPLSKADKAAHNIIKNGVDEDVISLIQGYARARHSFVDARLKQCEKRARKNKRMAHWLAETRKERLKNKKPARKAP